MSDDLTALARKWHRYGLMHGHNSKTCVVCEQTEAAIREALSEKQFDRDVVRELAEAAEEYIKTTELNGPDGLWCGECQEMGLVHTPVCPVPRIVHAIAALKGATPIVQ